jgi:hypothetical protein
MYHYASDVYGGASQVASVGLPMTPSVALRALFEQLGAWDSLTRSGRRVEVYEHFIGPVTPPRRHSGRAIGDPVFDAIAEYAALVVGRAGLLTNRLRSLNRDSLGHYERMSRAIFAYEHSLAIDLGRVAPEIALRTRHLSARAVLSVAAYWCDRCELLDIGGNGVHALLGARPDEPVGAVLWEHAVLSLTPPGPAPSPNPVPSETNAYEEVIDLTIGIGSKIPS